MCLLMAFKHLLMKARDSQWGPGKVHLAVDGSGHSDSLGRELLHCGIRASAGTYRGKLSEVECKKCLASIERQMAAIRGRKK